MTRNGLHVLRTTAPDITPLHATAGKGLDLVRVFYNLLPQRQRWVDRQVSSPSRAQLLQAAAALNCLTSRFTHLARNGFEHLCSWHSPLAGALSMRVCKTFAGKAAALSAVRVVGFMHACTLLAMCTPAYGPSCSSSLLITPHSLLIPIPMCAHARVRVHVRVLTYAHTHTRAHTYTHTHTHTHIHTHMSQGKLAEFVIDETFGVPGVGTVVAGTVKQGIIKPNTTLMMGG